jgi:hypothetical protein
MKRPLVRGRGVCAIWPLLGAGLAACSTKPAVEAAVVDAPRQSAPGVEAIYSGGDILTMVGKEPQYAEALAVQDGKIAAVGTQAEVIKLAGPATRHVDLRGRTLLPGFVDGHGHLLVYADSLDQANIAPPPVGSVRSIQDIVTAIRALQVRLNADDQAWLIGYGYDPDGLVEKRHPTAADLDTAFPTNPVVLMHVSQHMLVANSAALRIAGITAETPDPPGGTIIRKHGSREPQGLLQEMAALPFLALMAKAVSPERKLVLLRQAQHDYASAGLTTANEGAVFGEKLALLERAARAGALTLDVVALPLYLTAGELVGTGRVAWGTYQDRLKYQGLKLVLDGSVQGKTAYLSHPYLTPVPGCETDCRGYPSLTQEKVNQLMTLAYRNGVQVFAHSNGDAATDMVLEGHKVATAQAGPAAPDRRTVIVHSQVVRPDQLDAYAREGIFATFFSNHAYYWGDVHLANIGTERASFISPLHTAAAKGLRYANHTDTPVTPIDPLFLLWTAVNRVTRDGQVLGKDERVDPYRALQAQTLDAAYQYRDEDLKGTLEPGKLADLVILERNPLKVEPMSIKDIAVVETIKEGRSIYRRPQ